MREAKKKIDIKEREKYKEWIAVCENVFESIDSIDAVLIMTYRSEFHFDASVINESVLSDKVQTALDNQGYTNLVASPSGFSHRPNIGTHKNTKEIRVINDLTEDTT